MVGNSFHHATGHLCRCVCHNKETLFDFAILEVYYHNTVVLINIMLLFLLPGIWCNNSNLLLLINFQNVILGLYIIARGSDHFLLFIGHFIPLHLSRSL